MTNLLFITLETSNPNVEQAELQQVSLMLAEIKEDTDTNKKYIEVLKDVSFFIEGYTKDSIFDAYKDTPKAEPFNYQLEAAYDSVTKSFPLDKAKEIIQKTLSYCDYVVGHVSTDFHIPLLQRLGVDFTGKKIIDTSKHINYKSFCTSKKLLHICAEHNLDLFSSEQPFPRTVSINYALKNLLNLYEDQLNSILESSEIASDPSVKKIYLVAKISFSQKEEAKKEGFRYNPSLKHWYQEVTQERYDELLSIMGEKHLEIFNK